MNDDQTRLEMKITEVEQTLTELNGVVYEQQKAIDLSRNHLTHLESRLDMSVLREGTPEDRPPHY